MFPRRAKAILALADGTVFMGTSVGVSGETVGEIVFNTSMTGYQEIMTDPSYHQQIITFTYPHIGNYGINSQDSESDQIHASGVILKNIPTAASNFRNDLSFSEYLQQHNIIAIADIDTRQLTRLLRTNGTQNGCIIALPLDEDISEALIAKAIAQAQTTPNMQGLDLASKVCTQQNYSWDECTWQPTAADFVKQSSFKYRVVALDFGCKQNILRLLTDRECEVIVVPATTNFEQIMALQPDGVFLSNGPGDPAACTYAIETIQKIIAHKLPLFGICLGHQLLALAVGAKTYKMKFGHHGANHPVKDLASNKVFITSQNHGFAVDDNLPDSLVATHISLFDNSLQGIKHISAPAFSFQGHPEASPGPQDILYLFDQFITLMKAHKEQAHG